MLLGAGVGGTTGAALGRIIDGRVQIEAVILVGVVGTIVAVIVNRARRRRARASTANS